MICIGIGERNRQVETGVDPGIVRLKVDCHAPAGARDGVDGGLDAVVGAAESVEQCGAVFVAAVIDSQIVITSRRDGARQLEHIAHGGGQHEIAAVVIAVVAALPAVVIHLEGGDGGIAERQRVRACDWHVHKPVPCCPFGNFVVHREGHSVCPRRLCRHREHHHKSYG
ncbi:MAG: hypothetical protein IK006_05040 [Bacteroidaceae bacterium]|nr:hypothetical protein [Bacteroidaceae bacterium]